jgi:hypothetical protein
MATRAGMKTYRRKKPSSASTRSHHALGVTSK